MADVNATPIENVDLKGLLAALKTAGVDTVGDLATGIGLVKLKADIADINQKITAERQSRDTFVTESQAREAELVIQRDALQATITSLGI